MGSNIEQIKITRAREGGASVITLALIVVRRSLAGGGVPLKKSFAQKIFGSNLFLKNQKIEFIAQTQYAAVRAAYGKNGNFPASSIVVPRARVGLATPASSGLRSTIGATAPLNFVTKKAGIC